MSLNAEQIHEFLETVHPFDALPLQARKALVPQLEVLAFSQGSDVYAHGEVLPGYFMIYDGSIEVKDAHGAVISHLGRRNSFGERGLMDRGIAVTSARAESDATLLVLPAANFHQLISEYESFAKFFDRGQLVQSGKSDLTTTLANTLMATRLTTCTPETTAQEAALKMHEARVSSICVTSGEAKLVGIVTIRDLSGKVLAKGLSPETKVADIMTQKPLCLTPSAIGSDILHLMMERRVGHVPIVEGDRLVGIVTQTDLTRFQALNSATLAREIVDTNTAAEMAKITARIPEMLVQLVGGGNRHDVVTRLITDITDTVTRRLLALAEEKLGPPPVPYLWLACGSQGRQEQTGVGDQDNCLFLDNAATEADRDGYFADLANIVCDGLNECGYIYCPGDMMASNVRWRQTVDVWREYFKSWIRTPNPEAQMLASVMFDLRPINGQVSLYEDIKGEILKAASANSIFVAHMVSNSVKHTTALGLLRGLATIRAGEHKDTIDMKHNGVVPVVDLARLYTLQAELEAVNTRARLVEAREQGALSKSGAKDLLDAYDMIAQSRLKHQAYLINQGKQPDNFLQPLIFSDLERSHLRDAFVVVKTMQSAISQGRSMLG